MVRSEQKIQKSNEIVDFGEEEAWGADLGQSWDETAKQAFAAFIFENVRERLVDRVVNLWKDQRKMNE